AISRFLDERRTYVLRVDEFNAGVPKARHIFPRSILASVEEDVLQVIEHLEFPGWGLADAAINDDVLLQYFERRREANAEQMRPNIPSLLRELSMDASQKDVHSRVAQFFVSFSRCFREHGVENLMQNDTTRQKVLKA